MNRLASNSYKESTQALSTYNSRIEDSALNSNQEFSVPSNELTPNGENDIWSNNCEVCSFRNNESTNQDKSPLVIKKKSKKVKQVQPVSVRYLKPPTPPEPGPIIIRHEPNKPTAPASPLIMRQAPPQPATPPPLVGYYITHSLNKLNNQLIINKGNS